MDEEEEFSLRNFRRKKKQNKKRVLSKVFTLYIYIHIYVCAHCFPEGFEFSLGLISNNYVSPS